MMLLLVEDTIQMEQEQEKQKRCFFLKTKEVSRRKCYQQKVYPFESGWCGPVYGLAGQLSLLYFTFFKASLTDCIYVLNSSSK